MVTTVSYHPSACIKIFSCDENFYSLLSQQLSNIQHSVINYSHMLYIPGLSYCITASVSLLTPFTHVCTAHAPPNLWQPPICSLYEQESSEVRAWVSLFFAFLGSHSTWRRHLTHIWWLKGGASGRAGDVLKPPLITSYRKGNRGSCGHLRPTDAGLMRWQNG